MNSSNPNGTPQWMGDIIQEYMNTIRNRNEGYGSSIFPTGVAPPTIDFPVPAPSPMEPDLRTASEIHDANNHVTEPRISYRYHDPSGELFPPISFTNFWDE